MKALRCCFAVCGSSGVFVGDGTPPDSPPVAGPSREPTELFILFYFFQDELLLKRTINHSGSKSQRLTAATAKLHVQSQTNKTGVASAFSDLSPVFPDAPFFKD